MIMVEQLRHFVIRPVLQDIGLWSHTAEQLVLCTALHESHGGKYIDQLDRGEMRWGPALGIFQMEQLTHADHWRWLEKPGREQLALAVSRYCAPKPEPWRQLAGNMNYAAAMCRVHYRRKPGMPDGDNLLSLAEYWKRWYNTSHGSGTVEQFINACQPHWRKGL